MRTLSTASTLGIDSISSAISGFIGVFWTPASLDEEVTKRSAGTDWAIHRLAEASKDPTNDAMHTVIATPTASAETGTAVRAGARAKLSAASRPAIPNSHSPGFS